MTTMNFSELTKVEPELGRIERRIRQIGRRSGRLFCANRLWYANFKPAVEGLVGFGARNKALRSTQAYDLAYHYLYELLPDCRHDGGLCG